MLKHVNKEHKTERDSVSFNAKVTGTFQKPPQRFINEGLQIKWRKEEELLNSDIEFFYQV